MIPLLVVTLAVLTLSGSLFAQDQTSPLYGIFVRSSRVAVLPFVNYTDNRDLTDTVNFRVREELMRNGVEMADVEMQAELLRKRRIRNTVELTNLQLQLLAEGLQISYVLSGSLDRYETGSNGAEVALSARLIYVPTRELVWASSAVMNGRNSWWPLGLGRRQDAARMLEPCIHQLFRRFDYRLPTRPWPVSGLRTASGDVRPLKHLAVITLGNETDVSFAGQIVSNQFISELLKRGFRVTDPGLIRDVMLHEGELSLGSASADVLAQLAEKLEADAVLTGTVSEFSDAATETSSRMLRLGLELRLIDTRTGELLWARVFAATSRRGAAGFGWGDAGSMLVICRSVARELAHDLPVQRANTSVAVVQSPAEATP